ncbi:MAG: hypothetical protein RIS85_1004 [Pseudomonadota bacterium]
MAKPTGPVRAAKPRTKICAALAAKETKNNRHWQGEFLAALAETSNVTAASTTAGVHPTRPYKLKRTDNDFAARWREALCEGYDLLEMEVLHRLRFGEPKDGEHKFDNATALRLLSQHRETVARERAIRENADVETVRASIHAKLARMREEVLARRQAAAEEAGGADG